MGPTGFELLGRPLDHHAYWERRTRTGTTPFREHCQEIAELTKMVRDDELPFRSLPYGQLWEQWRGQREPRLDKHVERLSTRYAAPIEARNGTTGRLA